MARFKNPYASEEEMLVAFAAAAQALGWTVYPETGGCDILLVATAAVTAAGIQEGDQVAVEGKVTGNLKLLTQCMATRSPKGPSYHVAVVPRATPEFKIIARAMNIKVIEACEKRWSGGQKKWRRADFTYDLSVFPTLYRQYYDLPLWQPEMVVWTPPGKKSPKRLSPWKIKAVKLCLLGKSKGFLTSADFRAESMSMSVWRDRWIKDSGKRAGRHKRYVLRDTDYPRDPPPHLKYPEIVDALVAHGNKYAEDYRAMTSAAA